jgi:hypothetical protein
MVDIGTVGFLELENGGQKGVLIASLCIGVTIFIEQRIPERVRMRFFHFTEQACPDAWGNELLRIDLANGNCGRAVAGHLKGQTGKLNHAETSDSLTLFAKKVMLPVLSNIKQQAA